MAYMLCSDGRAHLIVSARWLLARSLGVPPHSLNIGQGVSKGVQDRLDKRRIQDMCERAVMVEDVVLKG